MLFRSKKQKRISFSKLLSTTLVSLALLAQLFPISFVSAGPIAPRSLTLSAGSNGDAGSKVSGIVNHNFSFQSFTTQPDVGSVVLRYCTTAAAVPSGVDCLKPTGVNTQTAAPATALANDVNGFTIDAVNSVETPGIGGTSKIVLTRPHAVIGGAGVKPVISFTMANITNPSTNPVTSSGTFFVRISIYTSEDGTGTEIDSGTVAASTVSQVDLRGIMPESLVFCVGKTISATDNVPDCRTANIASVTFNQLFSPSDTAYATSQMVASTNAFSGYVITVNGPTLTNGTSTIDPMNTLGIPIHGVEQFGLNLVKNTGINPGPVTYASAIPAPGPGTFGLNVGEALGATPNGLNLRGQPILATYGVVDQFKFTDHDPVAASNNGGAGPSDAQIFTVSYIANVTGSQSAGEYVSTLTYICTPTF